MLHWKLRIELSKWQLRATYILLLGSEGVLAAVEGLELVVGLEVGPAPHAAVDHVRQPLAMRHLQEQQSYYYVMIIIIIIHIHLFYWPVACHPGSGGWWHTWWRCRGCSARAPEPPARPWSSSASWRGRPPPSPPTSPPHHPEISRILVTVRRILFCAFTQINYFPSPKSGWSH